MSEHPNGGTSKLVYWILGIIGTFLVLLAGAVASQQVNQVTQIVNRLDSLDRRISTLEGDSREQSASRVETYRRLGVIETDTREIRERIRKLY